MLKFAQRKKVYHSILNEFNFKLLLNERKKLIHRFHPKTEDEIHSNMVIVEVSMPSGFLIEKDRLDDLLKKPHVKLVEMKRGETVADIYLDQMMSNEEICLEVQGYRSHKVADNKPVPVRIYDYYDSCE